MKALGSVNFLARAVITQRALYIAWCLVCLRTFEVLKCLHKLRSYNSELLALVFKQ